MLEWKNRQTFPCTLNFTTTTTFSIPSVGRTPASSSCQSWNFAVAVCFMGLCSQLLLKCKQKHPLAPDHARPCHSCRRRRRRSCDAVEQNDKSKFVGVGLSTPLPIPKSMPIDPKFSLSLIQFQPCSEWRRLRFMPGEVGYRSGLCMGKMIVKLGETM